MRVLEKGERGLLAITSAFARDVCYQCEGRLEPCELLSLEKRLDGKSIFEIHPHGFEAKRCHACKIPVVIAKTGGLAILGEYEAAIFFMHVPQRGEPVSVSRDALLDLAGIPRGKPRRP